MQCAGAVAGPLPPGPHAFAPLEGEGADKNKSGVCCNSPTVLPGLGDAEIWFNIRSNRVAAESPDE
jgi:hypothetical protein